MGTKQGIDQVMPSGYRIVPTDQETKQGIDQVMPSWYRFVPTDQDTKQGIDQVMPSGYRFVPTDQETKQGIVMPSGYRFVPTDEELVFHYLIKKVSCKPLPAQLISEMDAISFYSQPPMILVGADPSRQREWYFFVWDEEYYHGEKKKHQVVANGLGFWRSMGEEDPIYSSHGDVFAFKIHYTYFSGSPPNARRTHWRMELYRLPFEWDTESQVKMFARFEDDVPWLKDDINQAERASRSINPNHAYTTVAIAYAFIL
ncbi:hypothetical protein Acr_19g0006390 [Actinidia rufa]|uniref:NAC domain-containing protein n=1 Tax=Actinidia rufa TaxID=165716 RepID=A0A7J0GAD7_9ERIC|nr:hypothetical protein Acr_19g0006390 [Actinidia rufa]